MTVMVLLGLSSGCVAMRVTGKMPQYPSDEDLRNDGTVEGRKRVGDEYLIRDEGLDVWVGEANRPRSGRIWPQAGELHPEMVAYISNDPVAREELPGSGIRLARMGANAGAIFTGLFFFGVIPAVLSLGFVGVSIFLTITIENQEAEAVRVFNRNMRKRIKAAGVRKESAAVVDRPGAGDPAPAAPPGGPPAAGPQAAPAAAPAPTANAPPLAAATQEQAPTSAAPPPRPLASALTEGLGDGSHRLMVALVSADAPTSAERAALARVAQGVRDLNHVVTGTVELPRAPERSLLSEMGVRGAVVVTTDCGAGGVSIQVFSAKGKMVASTREADAQVCPAPVIAPAPNPAQAGATGVAPVEPAVVEGVREAGATDAAAAPVKQAGTRKPRAKRSTGSGPTPQSLRMGAGLMAGASACLFVPVVFNCMGSTCIFCRDVSTGGYPGYHPGITRGLGCFANFLAWTGCGCFTLSMAALASAAGLGAMAARQKPPEEIDE